MAELEIVLALAIAMLVFSTLVSAFVEVFHRFFSLRKHGFKQVVETFYEEEVLGRLERQLNASQGAPNLTDPDGDAARGVFNLQMWGGVATRKQVIDPTTVKRRTLAGLPLPQYLDGAVDRLDAADFFRRFAGTETGKRLARQADDEIDRVIDVLATRYEDYGRQATELFRKRSQLISVAAAVLFAFAMNVNVITLVETFRANDSLTRSMIKHTDAAVAQFEAQTASYQTLLVGGDAASPDDSQLMALEASISELKSDLKGAEKLGLPIGWPRPFWTETTHFLSSEKDDGILSFLAWAITTFATGLLIGLGGPFWYDMIKRLAMADQLIGALRGSLRPKAGAADGLAALPAETPEETSKREARIAFKEAVAAETPLNPPSQLDDFDWKGPKAMRL